MNSDRDIRIKRLHFRSWHRGCKETDLILGAYADHVLPTLQDSGLSVYESLLEEHDADIWNWISGRETCPNPEYDELITMLRDYRNF